MTDFVKPRNNMLSSEAIAKLLNRSHSNIKRTIKRAAMIRGGGGYIIPCCAWVKGKTCCVSYSLSVDAAMDMLSRLKVSPSEYANMRYSIEKAYGINPDGPLGALEKMVSSKDIARVIKRSHWHTMRTIERADIVEKGNEYVKPFFIFKKGTLCLDSYLLSRKAARAVLSRLKVSTWEWARMALQVDKLYEADACLKEILDHQKLVNAVKKSCQCGKARDAVKKGGLAGDPYLMGVFAKNGLDKVAESKKPVNAVKQPEDKNREKKRKAAHDLIEAAFEMSNIDVEIIIRNL